MKKYLIWMLLLAIPTLVGCNLIGTTTDHDVFSSVGDGVSFSKDLSEEELKAKGVTMIKQGDASIYIGYQQVSSNNQNPIMARFDNGTLTWFRDDYEVTGDDSKGYGLLWDGQDICYAVFSITGTQGSVDEDFRRFAKNGWLTSYGAGGGAKISVIAKVNASTGEISSATFLKAVKSDGKTNSLMIKDLIWENENLKVRANSWWSPLDIDRKRMEVSGSSPFDYTITFTPDLTTALTAEWANQ